MNRLVLLLMGRILLMCGLLQTVPLCYSLYMGLTESSEALAGSGEAASGAPGAGWP